MTLDLTSVIVSVTGGIFSILMIVVPAWVASKVNDKAAAATLSESIKNSLGAIQVAASTAIRTSKPFIEGVPVSLAPGVQYVLDHASDEAKRFGLTPDAIAAKIEAQIGLANIATNIAVSGSATPQVVKPLDRVPEKLV
jgi:hypothetical protein